MHRSYLRPETKAAFERDGFVVVSEFRDVILAQLKEVEREIDELGRAYTPTFNRKSSEGLSALGTNRSNFYVSLRYLQTLARFAASAELDSCSRDLGLIHPCLMNASNVRMDEAGDNPHQFHWHQDFTYLLGSPNSITYWIPFAAANETAGTVELVPASHRAGVFPYRITSASAEAKTSHMSPKDIELLAPPGSGQLARLERGDMLVFSQFLLHRTYPHAAGDVRWTVQVRHSDLSDNLFRKHGCPFGDTATVQRVPAYVAAINSAAGADHE